MTELNCRLISTQWKYYGISLHSIMDVIWTGVTLIHCKSHQNTENMVWNIRLNPKGEFVYGHSLYIWPYFIILNIAILFLVSVLTSVRDRCKMRISGNWTVIFLQLRFCFFFSCNFFFMNSNDYFTGKFPLDARVLKQISSR